MSALLIGYARSSTVQQDLTAQRDALVGLGVEPDRVYVDHGRTGTNRERPGLREALAAGRAGDTLVVTKLDRLAREYDNPIWPHCDGLTWPHPQGVGCAGRLSVTSGSASRGVVGDQGLAAPFRARVVRSR